MHRAGDAPGPALMRGFSRSIRRGMHLDEAREGDLSGGVFRRPNGDLLAVLPLDVDASDQSRPVFEAVRELVILGVELDAPHGADQVSLLQGGDQLVRIRRAAGALD